MKRAALLAIVAACSNTPAKPTVVGTLICEPNTHVLGAEVPDEIAEIESLEREVVAGVTSARFVRRIAAEQHVDEAELARAISARPVKDSRLVEIGVALPDLARATHLCDAILDGYVVDHSGIGSPDRHAPQRDDVRVLDHCAPPR